MQIPLQITFKDFPHSNALETVIRERAAKLERFAGRRMITCRVTVHEPSKRRQQGKLFAATVEVTLPGAELTVGHPSAHGDDHAHENPYIAIRDAFEVMERQIKEYRAIRRQGHGRQLIPDLA